VSSVECQLARLLSDHFNGPRAIMPLIMYPASTPSCELSSERHPSGPGITSAPFLAYA
jgi:hypothetical protein